MKIFQTIASYTPTANTIVTLGTFDGVHVGHKKIMERLVKNAIDLDCETLLLTFFPHPRMVLQEQSEIKLLNTMDEKSSLLKACGLQNLIIHPFDKAFSRLTAEEFVKDILVDRFKMKKIIIGHDHRFGRNRTANVNDLLVFGALYGFEVEQISQQEIDEVAISSTKIRNALLDGDITQANEYLGYSYFLSGIVVRGRELGRTIGYPTANIEIAENYKLIPKRGVYIIKSEINGKSVFGMMNIGVNPTVNGDKQTIEVNYFDFKDDLYGQKISISILKRIRSEQKFESLDALKMQLAQDRLTALAFFQTEK